MSIRTQLPDYLEGYGPVLPYDESRRSTCFAEMRNESIARVQRGKLLRSISAAFDACEIQDGATLSFHHHLRNGDHVLNLVLNEAAARGLRALTIVASSLFPVHAPLIEHVRRGVVHRVYTSYLSGPFAEFVSRGNMRLPVIMQTHGGRARAIESGELKIDVAFVAAPTSDESGNINGVDGPAACGPLGYAMVDAQHANRVVAITDHLVPYPTCPIDIAQDSVDFVVEVNSIGDPSGILSGTTRPTTDPVGLSIASIAAQVVEASGLLGEEFSFQTGAGGVSLAVASKVASLMGRLGIRGSFASGGITGSLCDMLEAGLFRTLFDVQCFDLRAVDSYRRDNRHQAMSASLYASPHRRGAVVDRLSTMILGASEVDAGFNVNVTTGSSGMLLGGSGGHADTAAGAQLAIVTTKLMAGGYPKLVEQVNCITTPGSTVDVVVTEVGVAVNPAREDLADRLRIQGVNVKPIRDLIAIAEQQRSFPAKRTQEAGRIVAVVEYRDGSVIDVVRSVEKS